MKAEKKPQVPVVYDIVLTLSPAEAKVLYDIAANFHRGDYDESSYIVPGDNTRFDVILHRQLVNLGVNRE